MLRASPEFIIMDAKGSAGVGSAFNLSPYQIKQISLATDGGGTAALTVKFQGSLQESAPDFGAVQSATNQWDYVEVLDLQDGTAKDGDTGITLSSVDDYRLLEINNKGLRWICARITSWTAGSLTLKVRGFDNK